jgi:isopentenyldiphosphate isomerase
LSQLLTRHILSELPGIVSRVQDRLADVDRKLGRFPVQDAAPTITIIQEIEKLKTAIVSRLNPDAISVFRTVYRKLYRDMQKRLLECQPQVELTTPGYVKKSISVDSSEEDPSPSKMSKRNDSSRAISATPRRTPGPAITCSGGGPSFTERRRKLPTTGSTAPGPTHVGFDLEEVKRKYDSAPGADLGGSSNLVTKGLVLNTMCGWKSVVDHVVKRIESSFLDMLTDSLEESLSARRSTMLFAKASSIARALLQELMKELRVFINGLMDRELYRPITYSALLAEKKDVWETELKALRLKQRAKEYYEEEELTTFKYPSEEAFKKKLADVGWAQSTLGKQLHLPSLLLQANNSAGKDKYEREVKELAMPFAYYEIASTQLLDNIARDVEFHLLHAYELRVHRKLCEELRTADLAYCTELLAEDPQRERERYALLAEKEKLMQALTELNSLPDTHA